MSEAQGGGLMRERFPPNTIPARRESQRCYGGNTVTDIGVIYTGDAGDMSPPLFEMADFVPTTF